MQQLTKHIGGLIRELRREKAMQNIIRRETKAVRHDGIAAMGGWGRKERRI
jgi:hypothetical protein